MTAAARQPSPRDEADQCVALHADWKTFEAVLAARADAPVPRLSYLDGVLELMSPAKTHESTAALIGRLLEVWADVNAVVIESTKSWTLKRSKKKVGVEPDESWVVGDRPDALLPDVVLEVVHTHGGLHKLEHYARLGVREVWFWIDGTLSIHVLRGPRYVRAARSHVFRALDIAMLVQFVKHPSPGRAPLLYRAALSGHR
jgi:Uma2 family endonuclease